MNSMTFAVNAMTMAVQAAQAAQAAAAAAQTIYFSVPAVAGPGSEAAQAIETILDAVP